MFDASIAQEKFSVNHYIQSFTSLYLGFSFAYGVIFKKFGILVQMFSGSSFNGGTGWKKEKKKNKTIRYQSKHIEKFYRCYLHYVISVVFPLKYSCFVLNILISCQCSTCFFSLKSSSLVKSQVLAPKPLGAISNVTF
jgi:hypothetical protein